MNKADFIVSLLESTGKEYPPGQVKIIFDIVKYINVTQFERAMAGHFEHKTRMPTIADIRLACTPALMKAKEEQRRKEHAQLDNCVRCGNSGQMFAFKKTNKLSEYAFRCNVCPRGEHMVKLNKWFNDVHAEEFQIYDLLSSDLEKHFSTTGPKMTRDELRTEIRKLQIGDTNSHQS